MIETTPLFERLPSGPVDPDTLLEIFIEWTMDRGLELYPAQEEAVLEIMSGRHVILSTPTGSGKSLVAVAMHFLAFATARRSIYTSPIKALVSEKFFELCAQFGAKNVGLMTGDASINRNAPIICCTAEILATLALTEGDAAGFRYAVLDEFHYYGDRERGMAWQLPLLTLPKTTFLLMSATLGDTSHIQQSLAQRSGREVALVASTDRPVPLDFTYSEAPLHEALDELLRSRKAPVYVVSFTQRGCADLAQGTMSINVCDKAEKKLIAQELKGQRFDTPYGKEVSKYLRHGIGVHHAGLLPKYRLLVERLSQKGMLKIIFGTDTLGVGINVPIRTVLFTKLCKYDGRKTRLLSVRHFKQIAGRAGRKGFDTEGSVVCQAPEHVIENKKMARKAGGDAKKLRRMVKKKPPERGYTHWDETTFRSLVDGDAEALVSRFKINQSMLLSLLQRPEAMQGPHGGYGDLLALIDEAHERPAKKLRLRKDAVKLFRSLRRAGVVELVPGSRRRGRKVVVDETLQRDFSMHQPLAFYLLFALSRLDQEAEDYALRVMSLVEAILEDPRVVLMQQQHGLRRERLAELKAEGVEYDDRIEQIEKIAWPMPDAEFIFDTYESYTLSHPWLTAGVASPKSVARDMFSTYTSFVEYVRQYGLERSEGVLLRYLSQAYKTLLQNVPEAMRTDGVVELIAWLRAELGRADSSLVQAWELMATGKTTVVDEPEVPRVIDVRNDKRAFRARVRAEVHRFVKVLSIRDYEEAARCLRGEAWTAQEMETALSGFYEDYKKLRFDHHARQPGLTRVEADGTNVWRVRQVLCDMEEDDLWYAELRIDLRAEVPEGPFLELVRLGT